jgi:hypothetical protein
MSEILCNTDNELNRIGKNIDVSEIVSALKFTRRRSDAE